MTSGVSGNEERGRSFSGLKGNGYNLFPVIFQLNRRIQLLPSVIIRFSRIIQGMSGGIKVNVSGLPGHAGQ